MQDLQTASDEQTLKNFCDHIKVSSKFLSLANAVCFLPSYTLDIFSTNLLKIVFFFSLKDPSGVKGEKRKKKKTPTFVCLLDPANIQCAGDIFINHSKRQIKNCGVLLQVNRLWAEIGPGL